MRPTKGARQMCVAKLPRRGKNANIMTDQDAIVYATALGLGHLLMETDWI